MLLHCHSCCHWTVAPAVAWIVHGSCLKRHNQGNGCHQCLSCACVFLPIAEFNIVENRQGGNLITLYSSNEPSYLSLWIHFTLPMLLMLLHCHSCCHYTIAPAVAWIVHGCRLKRQNQGNSCHLWLSCPCVFLPIAEFSIVENSQGGNLVTLYSSIELS